MMKAQLKNGDTAAVYLLYFIIWIIIWKYVFVGWILSG